MLALPSFMIMAMKTMSCLETLTEEEGNIVASPGRTRCDRSRDCVSVMFWMEGVTFYMFLKFTIIYIYKL